MTGLGVQCTQMRTELTKTHTKETNMQNLWKLGTLEQGQTYKELLDDETFVCITMNGPRDFTTFVQGIDDQDEGTDSNVRTHKSRHEAYNRFVSLMDELGKI